MVSLFQLPQLCPQLIETRYCANHQFQHALLTADLAHVEFSEQYPVIVAGEEQLSL